MNSAYAAPIVIEIGRIVRTTVACKCYLGEANAFMGNMMGTIGFNL